LVMRDVPYVNSKGEVKRGALIADLQLANDVTAGMKDHTVMWTGEYPCDEQGRPISRIEHGNFGDPGQPIAPGLVARFSFSSKPVKNGQKVDYPDYYAKMTTYAAILGVPAQAVDPSATAQTAPFIPADEENAIFKFIDTATSRAALDAATAKLA